MKTKILLLLLSILAGCSKNPTQQELEPQIGIIGGYQTDPSSDIARSTVSISTSFFVGEKLVGQGSCTGVIVTPTTVLSAGHCFSRPELYYDRMVPSIQFNTNLKERNPTIRPIAQIFAHPSYNRLDPIIDFALFDVAVIQLQAPVPNPYKPVPILFDFSKLQKNMPVIVAGYGVSERPDTSPGFLKHTELSLLELEDDRVALSGSNNNNSCRGDSGGPAFVRINGALHLVGTSSYGISTNCDAPAIYTRLDNLADFLTPFLEESH